MKLQDVINGRALHVSGMYFLDSPEKDRRFVMVVVDDPYHGIDDDENGYSTTCHSTQPADFPEDGWVLLPG